MLEPAARLATGVVGVQVTVAPAGRPLTAQVAAAAALGPALVQVTVPAGPATVTLDYDIDEADIIGRALTAASLVIAIAALLIDRRRRYPGAIDPVPTPEARATIGP